MFTYCVTIHSKKELTAEAVKSMFTLNIQSSFDVVVRIREENTPSQIVLRKIRKKKTSEGKVVLSFK